MRHKDFYRHVLDGGAIEASVDGNGWKRLEGDEALKVLTNIPDGNFRLAPALIERWHPVLVTPVGGVMILHGATRGKEMIRQNYSMGGYGLWGSADRHVGYLRTVFSNERQLELHEAKMIT